MKAILLAAGLGTRLRPITDSVPKCLVPINSKPLLQIWLERLTAAGIGPFLINTHYLAGQVESFIKSGPFVDQVTLMHETKLLGTAGTLVANLDFLRDGDGMLIHADNYCMADLPKFLQAHEARPPECLMTMMTFRTPDPSSCGILELDERGVVTDFHEKLADPPGDLANSAIYILSAELIRLLRIRSASEAIADFSNQVIPNLMNRIYTYQTNEPFADIGTVASYEKLNTSLLKHLS